MTIKWLQMLVASLAIAATSQADQPLNLTISDEVTGGSFDDAYYSISTSQGQFSADFKTGAAFTFKLLPYTENHRYSYQPGVGGYNSFKITLTKPDNAGGFPGSVLTIGDVIFEDLVGSAPVLSFTSVVFGYAPDDFSFTLEMTPAAAFSFSGITILGTLQDARLTAETFTLQAEIVAFSMMITEPVELLSVSVVPEPSVYMMAISATGIAFLAARRRRK
jgi:hypothetical protein